MNNIQDIQVPYEDMLKAGMHFGRKKTVFNPAMKNYVFTVRDGICIIDLLKTKAQLKNSVEFLRKVIESNGTILFVALTKQSVDAIKDLSEALNMPYVIDRWLGGTLTNFKVINNRVKQFDEMEQAFQTGKLDKYTKKEKLIMSREVGKMKTKFEGLKKLSKLPDVVFVSSLKESSLPVKEAQKMGIKIVAIANTDANPNEADYIIPANDRSKKSVDLIISNIKEELQSK